MIGRGIECGRQHRKLPSHHICRSLILILLSFLAQVYYMVSQYEVICPKCVKFLILHCMLHVPSTSVLWFNDHRLQQFPFHFETCWNRKYLSEKVWLNFSARRNLMKWEVRNEAVSCLQYEMLLNLIADNKGEGEFWMYNFTNHKFRVVLTWDFMYRKISWKICRSFSYKCV
jgi:hypothetical protein